jgi:hypothetical protein
VRLLRSYLDDHAAVLLAAVNVADRMRASPRHAGRAALLEEVGASLRDDRAVVVALLRGAGGSPSRVKGTGAWLAERAGRLKPNGSLTSTTALTPLVELEGLGAMLQWDRAMWRALERAGGPGAGDAAPRAERAERHMADVERERLAVAAAALAPGR